MSDKKSKQNEQVSEAEEKNEQGAVQDETLKVGDLLDETEISEPSVDDLKKQLEVANAKAQESWDKLMRATAEVDNLRKRQSRELENAHKYALERFSNELLQVRDSLELGHQAALDETADVAKLREGTELTLKLMSDVMEKFGIEQINPEGEPFNPEQHQAMSMQPRDDVDPNTVIQVVQKGYSLNGRLIRPAMVLVSQAAG